MNTKLNILNILIVLLSFAALSANTLLIPKGSRQIYEYKNVVNIQDNRDLSYKSGYQFTTKVKIASVWTTPKDSDKNESQLLYIEIEPFEFISTKISKNKNDIPKFKIRTLPELARLKYLDFYVLSENGLITKFLTHKDDKDVASINLKRGIASYLQIQFDKFNKEVIQENDVQGTCSVSYFAHSTTQFLKTKHSCSDWELKANQRFETPLAVKKESYQQINYFLSSEQMLVSIDAIESHHFTLPIKKDAGIKIESEISLKRVEETDGYDLSFEPIESVILNLQEKKNYALLEIEADIDGRVSKINTDLKTLVKKYKNEMENIKIGKLSAAYVFSQLLPIARVTKKADFIKILKAKTMAENLHQIIDLIAATQTTESHNAFMEVYPLDKEDDFDLIERYFQGLAIGSHPQKKIIQDLYQQVHTNQVKLENTNEKLYDTLIQTLASLTNKYAFASSNGFEDDLVLKVKDFILHKLNKCYHIPCRALYTRSLQNLKDPSTISTLIDNAIGKEGLERAVSVQSMKALAEFDVKLFTNKDRKAFENIFYQISNKYDSTARTLSLDILLEMKPTKQELQNLINYLMSNDNSFEVKRYLIEKLKLVGSKCPEFASLLKDILRNKPEVNNYHIIGQKGLSSVLERSLSIEPAFKEDLLSAQEISSGVLKQGNVEYILKAGKDQISTFKLGLFTQGLASFVSSYTSSNEEQPTGEEEEDMKAGMEIAVQNVHFRPLIFFTGQSELMGHVWSGTASEPTTAYQATIIQQDHEEYVLLQNGATLHFQVIGSKSIDLNGSIQLSIWNRNAQTQIKKNSGETIYGTLTYGTSFVKIKNEFSIETNPKISVNANVDFYSDIKLCIQLEKPKSSLRHRIENTLEIIGDNKKDSNLITITTKMPGKTLALNQKNNEMCNQIG